MPISTSTNFFYRGPISSSKSLFNRALVVQSFFPELKLKGSSACDDVQKMQTAVGHLKNNAEIECGNAGTVLRFMTLRASRQVGSFRMKGSRRLFERPQGELLFILNQLSVRAELLPGEIVLESHGWKRPLMPLHVNRENSSQFATGILMSAWKLDFPLEFMLHPSGEDDSYWNMSLNFAQKLGMEIQNKGKDHYVVPANQKCRASEEVVEPDYSSAFSVAVMAALAGEAHITEVGASSLQPDYGFLEILRKLRVPMSLENNTLSIYRAAKISRADIVIKDTPDLFPVLAVLCAFAEGESRLVGAPRLVHKESNRIRKTAELLKLIGVETRTREDGLIIMGRGDELKPTSFDFDPDQDHRMAMAAGILMRAGWGINLKTPEVVNKSFPEFWDIFK